MVSFENVLYAETEPPRMHRECMPVDLTNETMQERLQKVLSRMRSMELDVLLVYADREHGSNFSYLTGFAPRFEESLLVLYADGTAFLILGNEMLRMGAYSRLPAKTVHAPHFSLPNQPMQSQKCFRGLLQEVGLQEGLQVGIVGWKLFCAPYETEECFDVPYFIVKAVMELTGRDRVVNATSLFIDPVMGARITMNANEIAFYEYGACLASIGVRDLLDHLEIGRTELELAGYLEHYGQPNIVQTICATGDRFINAVVSPRNKQVALGDRFSATVGYRGGLTNRSGYVAASGADLPEGEKDYLQRVAIPYFMAMAVWYSEVRPGRKTSEIYDLMERIVPKKMFGWSLNPGHYVADEEWVSSPFTENARTVLKSGMLLQMDIILKVPGFGGCNGEDGVALMDRTMQQEMAGTYPEVWKRLCERQRYVKDKLGIALADSVFPMSDLCGYIRPLLLDKTHALRLKKSKHP